MIYQFSLLPQLRANFLDSFRRTETYIVPHPSPPPPPPKKLLQSQIHRLTKSIYTCPIYNNGPPRTIFLVQSATILQLKMHFCATHEQFLPEKVWSCFCPVCAGPADHVVQSEPRTHAAFLASSSTERRGQRLPCDRTRHLAQEDADPGT